MNAKKVTSDTTTVSTTESQTSNNATIAALGCYLDKKAKDVYDATPDFPIIRSPNPRNTSRAVFGLAVKLTNITKFRAHKRRSGLKIKRTATQRSDKLGKKDGKSYRDVQAAAMLHRQKHGNPLDMSEKVLTAFRAVAHLWLQRKQRRDKALKDNVTSNLVMRHSKMSTMSENVFDIISKNFVTAVPALQFFDDRNVADVPKPTVSKLPTSPLRRPHTSRPVKPSRPSMPETTALPTRPATSRAAAAVTTPRGICYTVTDDGQRMCKTEHNMSDLELDRAFRGRSNNKVMSVEDALLLNMNKRLKIRMGLKKNRLRDISTAFNEHQKHLTETLVATLAMHWAEQEDMHVKKLTVACLNDTTMPSFRMDKHATLSHLRHEKWRLLEMCKLVSLFGAMLRAAEDTPGDMTRSEMRVLSLFRILIEDHSILTPIVLKSILAQLTPADLQCPRVEVLLRVVQKRLMVWKKDSEPVTLDTVHTTL
ncbi:hypothetical protein H310_01389 [Aphanomyces invadans]|uniref:Uncharacterized protein n=1 Tax=Aphanomyces invadans TaxID=157072 RepID=A0A024UR60_9STRA|nr:hypothetical protein H310_01389 [Aphanomyces invadans]ETW08896.1 hypothetical protein H310_01389 [Aphanomyces invadans]|eukprot:XP_008862701.1 hypothetical protein H310_01389 [Aphanomyces invadans]